MWELLTAENLTVAAVLLTVITSLIAGVLVPSSHHKWAVDMLAKDRDDWRRHAESLEQAVERLSDLMLMKRGRS